MAQLAEKSGTSSSLISDLENNKGKVPRMFTLMSIARALNIPDDSLIKIFMKYNKAPREIGESAESTLQKLLLGFQLPTSTVNDAMMLLKMISSIGTIHSIKNSNVKLEEGITMYEQNSVNYLNELVDLYSQYSHKTKK